MTPSRWILVLKAGVLAALLTVLLRAVDLERIAGAIGNIPARVFAAGILLTLASLALQAFRWRLLLKDPGIPFRECLAFVGLGVSLNLVAPSAALSDGAVSYWLGRRNADVLKAMSTLLAAKLIGTLCAAGFLLVAMTSHLWVFARLPLEWSPVKAAFTVAAVGAAGLALLLIRRYRQRFDELAHRALPALLNPAILSQVVLISLVIHATQFTVYWLAFRAVGAPVAYLDVCFFSPLVTVMSMIPVSLGGIGVREGMQIFFYTLIPGVEKEMVLAQAGYNYLVLFAVAFLNLLFASMVLRHPGHPAAGSAALPQGPWTTRV